MAGRIIETMADVAEGTSWLARRDAGMARALDCAGLPPLRRRPDGFAALRDAICGQMVSTAAARAMIARLDAAGLADGPAVAAAGDAALVACGLSRAKARHLLGIAESEFVINSLRHVADAEVQARLVALPGVGRWTAEIYAITALGRADVFAPGDLALREAVRRLYGLPDRPAVAELSRRAAAWSPWRAVAARLLWAYYRSVREREGLA